MSEFNPPGPEEFTEMLQRSAGLFFGIGVLQIVLGVAAILAPQVATVIGVEFLAVMLCVSGVAQGFLMFRIEDRTGTFLLLVGAVVSLAAGVLILRDPEGGALAVTLLMALSCFAEGVGRVALGFSPAGASARGAIVLCGLASIGLGVLLFVEWPGDAVWALGLLLGVNLLMAGVSLTAVGIAARGGGGPKAA